MKKILSVVLAVMVLISVFVETQFTVMATQSMSGNFNKGYSMTNNPATNMVNIAVAQNERTQGSLGYSEAWCADFVSDCAKLAGQSAAIPFNGVVQSMYSAVINAGGKVVGSAQAGDLVFFTNGSGYGHVGIATDGTHNISGNIYYLGASPSKVKILENRYEGFKSWTFVRPNYQGVPTPVINPQGCFDWVKSNSPGTIQVHGWAFDRDDLGASLAIHIYVGGPAGSGAPGYAITANKSRPDVNSAYPGVGNNHGFDDTIRVSKTGLQTIYVYAINVGSGNDNPLLGYQNVVIKELAGEINISNGDYYIANASNDNKVLSIKDGSVNNCANVEIAQRKNNEDSQIFTVRHLANGFYAIINKKSGLYLDVYNAENRPGVNVQQHTGNDSDAQKWVFKEVDSHIYQIISKCNYLFLDLENGDTTDGTNVRIWSENDTNALRWKLIPAINVIPTSPSTPSTTKPTVSEPDNTIWAENLDIDYRSVMRKGTKQKIVTDITPKNATNKTIEWYSRNSSVATVSNTGIVTAKRTGYVTICAGIDIDVNTTLTCFATIRVVESVSKVTIKYRGVAYNNRSINTKKGKTMTLSAVCYPTNAYNKKVSWTSTNNRIATVTQSGKVKAKKKGTCYIKATAKDGSKKYARVKINVK